jgi:hypothetical protein
LNARKPEAIESFREPAMQNALFTVQKQYAISGDEELGDLLVDILVDRAGEQKRNMLQIVLDEALSVAPKLTIEQLDTITLSFLLSRTQRCDTGTYHGLIEHLAKRITPFIENLTNGDACYSHIEYLGCGHIRAGNFGALENIFRRAYKGCFSNGFLKETVENELVDFSKFEKMLIPCFHDNNMLQFNFLDDEVLEGHKEKGLSEDEMGKLRHLFERTTMSQNDIKNLIIRDIPSMSKVFDSWDSSSLKNLELTGVGIAIAHANYRRKTGDTMDLSIWIK